LIFWGPSHARVTAIPLT